jgi:hypothetical protein
MRKAPPSLKLWRAGSDPPCRGRAGFVRRGENYGGAGSEESGAYGLVRRGAGRRRCGEILLPHERDQDDTVGADRRL